MRVCLKFVEKIKHSDVFMLFLIAISFLNYHVFVFI